MSMRKVADVVATTGKYENKEGEKKSRYSRVGSLFQDSESKRLSIKLDTIPVTPDWSGWLSCYPLKKDGKDAQPKQQEKVVGNGEYVIVDDDNHSSVTADDVDNPIDLSDIPF